MELLKKRVKSFLWRALPGLAILYIGYLSEILPNLNLPTFITVGLVYMFNEITKALNS